MGIEVELNVNPPQGLPVVVEVPLKASDLRAESSALENKETGQRVILQADGEKVLLITSEPLSGTWELKTTTDVPGVEIRQSDDAPENLSLSVPEGFFSEYHTDKGARPFLWPVEGPDGVRLTRAFPMEEIDGETDDHPHHRSFWSAFDEVNEVNNWLEKPGHGYTVHQEYTNVIEGPVYGQFTAVGAWTSAEGAPILDETRTIRLYNAGADARLLEYTVTLVAAYGSVVFHDTKEGGLISIRVASSMDAKEDGMIINSEGGRAEEECWGQKARWVDYSGPAGEDKSTFGFTIFDHPSNPNHPPRWHVRNYGLFSANPFSTAAFNQGEETPFTIPAGQSATVHYRVLIHRGDGDKEILETEWDNFVNP